VPARYKKKPQPSSREWEDAKRFINRGENEDFPKERRKSGEQLKKE